MFLFYILDINQIIELQWWRGNDVMAITDEQKIVLEDLLKDSNTWKDTFRANINLKIDPEIENEMVARIKAFTEMESNISNKKLNKTEQITNEEINRLKTLNDNVKNYQAYFDLVEQLKNAPPEPGAFAGVIPSPAQQKQPTSSSDQSSPMPAQSSPASVSAMSNSPTSSNEPKQSSPTQAKAISSPEQPNESANPAVADTGALLQNQPQMQPAASQPRPPTVTLPPSSTAAAASPQPFANGTALTSLGPNGVSTHLSAPSNVQRKNEPIQKATLIISGGVLNPVNQPSQYFTPTSQQVGLPQTNNVNVPGGQQRVIFAFNPIFQSMMQNGFFAGVSYELQRIILSGGPQQVCSLSGQIYTFELNRNHTPIATFTPQHVPGDNPQQHQFRITSTIMNMIDNVITNGGNPLIVNVDTTDENIKMIAREYIEYLKNVKGLPMQATVSGVEISATANFQPKEIFRINLENHPYMKGICQSSQQTLAEPLQAQHQPPPSLHQANPDSDGARTPRGQASSMDPAANTATTPAVHSVLSNVVAPPTIEPESASTPETPNPLNNSPP